MGPLACGYNLDMDGQYAMSYPVMSQAIPSVQDRIDTKLRTRFAPLSLEIRDESHLHAGHAGAPAGGQSHFRIRIVSTLFEGLGLVARQRLVNETLKDELAGPIHALAMKTLTPQEDAAVQD